MTTIGGQTTVKVSGDRDIVITRVFDAPRALVFEAFTTPELLKRWLLGPPGWTMPVCDVDFRVGGAYRYVWRNEKGTEMGMGGVFREIRKPERIVSTERFDEAWYPGEMIGTLEFEEQGGKTTMTQTLHYASREARDSVMKSDMKRGLDASYDRLSDMLATSSSRGAEAGGSR